ncbi:uncharacterized protein BO88DRAFT_79354 [Aspergillus vadensis CBS 113365]|uniref:Uncharacterized protein n=1 Tax=Aspergillus vadensis (strain CBS 113365 / IMI 142717 / IBT 24658) TaxID=1448311 RepID=A0A319CG66_ASPVC|nr:hypothetical protein BO88DRAFT_79354 [Aspergillus vadensis CBS 113365]PYH67272.1 hypothetical protein BO88DRAFT_79354 [Aspergillus vadensis CBS 113365]
MRNFEGTRCRGLLAITMLLTEDRRQPDCGLITMGPVLRICIPEAFSILLVYHLPGCTWKFLKSWLAAGLVTVPHWA